MFSGAATVNAFVGNGAPAGLDRSKRAWVAALPAWQKNVNVNKPATRSFIRLTPRELAKCQQQYNAAMSNGNTCDHPAWQGSCGRTIWQNGSVMLSDSFSR